MTLPRTITKTTMNTAGEWTYEERILWQDDELWEKVK